jgi:hypothetical protein
VLLSCVLLQVADALAAAQPYREQLQRRGVLVVALPVFEPTDAGEELHAANVDCDCSWCCAAVAVSQVLAALSGPPWLRRPQMLLLIAFSTVGMTVGREQQQQQQQQQQPASRGPGAV